VNEDEVEEEDVIRSRNQNANWQQVHVYFDGASRANPGPAGIGFVIYGKSLESSTLYEVERFTQYIGYASNNIAEYRAALSALRRALKHVVSHGSVRISGDSQVVIKQLRAQWRTNNSILRKLRNAIRAVERRSNVSTEVQWSHVPRSLNKVADALANKALDEAGFTRRQGQRDNQTNNQASTEGRECHDEVVCPICRVSLNTMAHLAGHLRTQHGSGGVSDDWIMRKKLARCPQCKQIFKSLGHHLRFCTCPSTPEDTVCEFTGRFQIETDTDLLEALSQASKGEEVGWDKLLGPLSSHSEPSIEEDLDTVQWDQEIPTASQDTQLLAASTQIEKGSLRKASTQLTSLGVAPNTAMVRQQLREMNPGPYRSYQALTGPETSPWNLSTAQVKKQLLALKSDAAPGPSGLKVTSLKRAASTEEGAAAIANIVNKIMNGTAPNKERLTGATLVPLVKSQSKVRPIAIGEIFTRLAARCLLRQQSKDLANYFAPIQMGVQQPGGAERIVHSVRKAYNAGDSILSLDLSNAFNRINRMTIRATLSEHFPGLLRYFDWAYGHSAPLWYENGLLTRSQEGVRQGDPLGPALFAAGIHHVLVRLEEEFPATQVLAFLDDVTVTGPKRDLVAFSRRFRELMAECGLEMNPNKSVLCLPPGSHTPSQVGHMPVSRDGVWILGSPIGTRDYEGEQVLLKVENMQKMVLLQSESSIPIQHRYLLLRDCVLPSLNYLLRTVPPENRQNATTAFDTGIRRVAHLLMGTDVYKDGEAVETSRQLYLPLRYGGLGLVLASFVSTAAYTASKWESGVELESSEKACLVAILRDQGVDISEDDLRQCPPTKKQQKVFVDQIVKQKVNELLQEEDEEGKARVLACQEIGAQDWISGLPSLSYKQFSDSQWRMLVRLRLGWKVTRDPLPSRCPLCEQVMESFPHHAFSCNYVDMKRERDVRHNHIRDSLVSGFSFWGLPVDKESRILTSQNLRGDLEIPQPSGPLVIDTSVINPSVVWTQQNVRPTAATGVREHEKCRKYVDVCSEAAKGFLPFVLQNMGGIGRQGLNFLADLKNRPACLHVYQPAKFVFSMRQGLVCRLMKSNSNIVLRWIQLVLPLCQGGVVYS
jgi:ribonuclease HI